MRILLGSLLLIFAGIVVFFAQESTQKQLEWYLADNPQRLSITVERKLEEAAKEGKLPKEWASLAGVTYSIQSDLGKKLLEKQQPEFTLLPDITENSSTLEVEVLDLPDESNPGLIFQMSLIKNKNKIHELGLTVYLSELQ